MIWKKNLKTRWPMPEKELGFDVYCLIDSAFLAKETSNIMLNKESRKINNRERHTR